MKRRNQTWIMPVGPVAVRALCYIYDDGTGFILDGDDSVQYEIIELEAEIRNHDGFPSVGHITKSDLYVFEGEIVYDNLNDSPRWIGELRAAKPSDFDWQNQSEFVRTVTA